jgi:chloride channel protein, CIC family
MNPTAGSAPAFESALRISLGAKAEQWLTRLLGGQSIFLLVLAALVGVAGGYGAILFRLLIGLVHRLAFPAGIGLDSLYASPWYALVLAPAAGGLLVGPLVHFFAPEAMGHGVPEVMDACANRNGHIRPRVAVVKILASALCIGSGGSVGREGPIVQIGSAVGSSIGQLFNLSGDRLRTLVASGAAAGIAATFNAPIAGFLFATEVILGRGSAQIFSPMIVASVSATVISRLHLGNSPAFLVAPYDLVSPWELLLYILLGAAAALVGVGFTKGLYALEDLWGHISFPASLKPVLGGAIVGAVALWFPQVMGVGYEHIEEVLHGQSAHLPFGTLGGSALLLLLVGLKIFATGTTIGSGGSGGIFAPSLFMGASLGGAFGTVARMLMPAGSVASPGAYALVGMGAVVGATTHAPLAAILIVFELTDRHTIILPLMLSCILSTVMAIRLSRDSIYTLKLRRRGSSLHQSSHEHLLASMQVKTLVRSGDVAQVLPATSLEEIVRRVVDGHAPHLYVTDSQRQLLGEIAVEDIALLLHEERFLEDVVVAADVMRPPPAEVSPDETLDRCLALFGQQEVEELPVVDSERRLLGRIRRADVISLYNREVLHREFMLRFVEDVERAEVPSLEEERIHLPLGDVRVEIAVDGGLVGRSLKDLDLRARSGASVFAVRGEYGAYVPDPETPLARGQKLEVFGTAEQVARVKVMAIEGKQREETKG